MGKELDKKIYKQYTLDQDYINIIKKMKIVKFK